MSGKLAKAVFKSEGCALAWIKARISLGTVVNADEASGWNDLASKYEMKRINHAEAYSAGEACTNQAESYFSRLPRAEMGHHHHVSGPYLLRYAQEAAFRKMRAALITAHRSAASRNWPCIVARPLTSPDTTSGTSRQRDFKASSVCRIWL
jgi:hypothetical protein